MFLKSNESLADSVHAAKGASSLVDRTIFKADQRPKLFLVEFIDALIHILRKHEIEKRLKLWIVRLQSQRARG